MMDGRVKRAMKLAHVIRRTYHEWRLDLYEPRKRVAHQRAEIALQKFLEECLPKTEWPVVGQNTEGRPTDKPAASSAPGSSAAEILRELVALKDSGDELRQNSRGLNAHAADELAAEYGKRLAAAWDRARASVSVPKEQQ